MSTFQCTCCGRYAFMALSVVAEYKHKEFSCSLQGKPSTVKQGSHLRTALTVTCMSDDGFPCTHSIGPARAQTQHRDTHDSVQTLSGQRQIQRGGLQTAFLDPLNRVLFLLHLLMVTTSHQTLFRHQRDHAGAHTHTHTYVHDTSDTNEYVDTYVQKIRTHTHTHTLTHTHTHTHTYVHDTSDMNE